MLHEGKDFKIMNMDNVFINIYKKIGHLQFILFYLESKQKINDHRAHTLTNAHTHVLHDSIMNLRK